LGSRGEKGVGNRQGGNITIQECGGGKTPEPRVNGATETGPVEDVEGNKAPEKKRGFFG